MSGQWPCYPFHLNSISQCKASGPFIPSIWTLFLSVRSVASLSLVSERLVVFAISLSLPSGHHLSVSCQVAPLSFSSGLHLSVSGQSPFSPFHLNATSSVRPVAPLSLLSGVRVQGFMACISHTIHLVCSQDPVQHCTYSGSI